MQTVNVGSMVEGLAPLARVREAAERMRLSERSIFRMAARGELKLVRVGKRTLVPRDEIARVLAESMA